MKPLYILKKFDTSELLFSELNTKQKYVAEIVSKTIRKIKKWMYKIEMNPVIAQYILNSKNKTVAS